MAPLSRYLIQAAFLRIKKSIRFVNGLQLIGCLVDVAAFVGSLGSGQAGNLYNPFTIEFQALVLGLYLTIPSASIVLSIGKNLDEDLLMLSLILTILAIAIGVVPIAVIFQGYTVLTLPLLFFCGYLLNIPAIVGKGVPMSHLWRRKRRGSPVGEYGNLRGIPMGVYAARINTLVVYALVLGLPSIIFLVDVSSQPPNSFLWPGWNVFIIFGIIVLSGVILAPTLAHILRSRTDWHEIVLDTYENHVLWWYDSRGFLVPLEFKNPTLTSVEGNQIRLSMRPRGLGTDLRFYSNSDLGQFLQVLNPIRSDFGSK